MPEKTAAPETITAIEEVSNFIIQPIAPLDGENKARLGMTQMIHALFGVGQQMDGYQVTTKHGEAEHRYLVLIDNGQSCCESWGYLSSDDDLGKFIGADLLGVAVTDTALNKKKYAKVICDWRDEDEDLYLDEGGIMFVDFETSAGRFQLAVYNGHNGCYGHGILIAKDDDIILNGTL